MLQRGKGDRDREQDQEKTKPPVKENAQTGRHEVPNQNLEDVRLLRSEIALRERKGEKGRASVLYHFNIFNILSFLILY